MSCESSDCSSGRRRSRSTDCRESSRSVRRVEVVRGFGTVDSIGVPSVGCNVTDTEQVDFKIRIFRREDRFEGEVNIVNFDRRRKFNSNDLMFFTGDENGFLCVFCVTSDDGCCRFEMVVEASPIVCARGTAAMFFAYSAPINTVGINIGGEVVRGEILFCENACCCD